LQESAYSSQEDLAVLVERLHFAPQPMVHLLLLRQKPQTLIQNFQELFTQQQLKLKPQVGKPLLFNAISEMNSRLRPQLIKQQKPLVASIFWSIMPVLLI